MPPKEHRPQRTHRWDWHSWETCASVEDSSAVAAAVAVAIAAAGAGGAAAAGGGAAAAVGLLPLLLGDESRLAA